MKIPWTLPVLLLFLLSSCGEPDALFLADDAWVALKGSEKQIEKEFRALGYKIELKVVGIREGDSLFSEILQSSQVDPVILSPLLSGHTDQWARGFPGRRFIAYGTWNHNNVFSIYSDRAAVMKETGIRCAQWVSGLERPDKRVAALFLSGSDERNREYDAFMEGWDSVECDCSLELKTLGPEDNPDELDSFLSLDLLETSVLGIFFVGPFNKRALEYCSGVSLPVVTEHIPAGAEENDDYLYIVRDFYIESVAEALEILSHTDVGGGKTALLTRLVEGAAGIGK